MKLPELTELLKLKELNVPEARFETLGSIQDSGQEYPVVSVIIGPEDKSLPTLGLFGGVHGLERIGSQVIIAFFHTLLHQMKWEKDLRKSFDHFRLVSIPIINPGGMARRSRSNPHNVDLMRNAPVEAKGKLLPLVSGHRISSHLPWYRGNELQEEARILVEFVKQEMFPSQASVALDVHSGFGVQDQIWYPYARQKGNFPKEKEALKLKALLDETFPHHIYKFEAQSDNYLTHGDLWDYLFDLHEGKNLFLPLTLELGSWNWIRKNPLQFFSKTGLFHPIKRHRHSRIMRRHLLLIDFLMKAVKNSEHWNSQS